MYALWKVFYYSYLNQEILSSTTFRSLWNLKLENNLFSIFQVDINITPTD